MAEGGDNIGDGVGADINADDMEKVKKVRRLRELWHGRFTNRNIATLLRHHDWDVEATNLFILDALPGELRDVLGGEDWHLVENVRRNNVLRDLARLNRIGHEVRQYGCRPDDNMWWRRVPSRKPVSQCKRCKHKYEPIPREQEWGWARFECICAIKFNAFAMMDKGLLGPQYIGKSQSLCYTCMSHLCEPIQILPPMRRRRNIDGDEEDGRNVGNGYGRNGGTGDGRNGGTRDGGNVGNGYGRNGGTGDGRNGVNVYGRNGGTGDGRNVGNGYGRNGGTRDGRNGGTANGRNNGRGNRRNWYDRRRPRKHTHRCTAPNCYRRYTPDPRSHEPLVQICVHPNSLKNKVHGFGSDRHISTGSTVGTCLSQDDIDASYEPCLADIEEADEIGDDQDNA
ncbi:shiftless antiviral inhibitor of ribosomal frameshifting protein homolog isoform X3 [Ruditapes philippinarum]|uniref:shiftless antiviral inhibitor of ribosomal frameshifting protein homolog isoform X3 n=1 Tax=Ruditapes philippinarum TaxID=129788 RepID=UPI00295A5B03|nr:shiftless antiviral inhibitor of ribosomal frameshifting protein homolog isoform X3 [Ruditapes philippinarum]